MVIKLQELAETRKQELERSYQAKEVAWTEFKAAMSRKAAATVIHNLAHDQYVDAKNALESLCPATDESKQIWEDFNKLKEEIDAKIETLKAESAEEHSEMKRCYTLSNKARSEQRGFLADDLLQQGYAHRDRRDDINYEIAELSRQLREAKQDTKDRTARPETEAVKDAKELAQHWKAKFEIEKDKMAALKAECDELRTAAEEAQAAYEQVKKDYAQSSNNTVVEPEKIEPLDEIAREDAEIMRILNECAQKEMVFRKESARFKKKVKRNWALDAAGVGWLERLKAN